MKEIKINDCGCGGFSKAGWTVIIVVGLLLALIFGLGKPGSVSGDEMSDHISGLTTDIKKYQARRIMSHITYKVWIDNRLDVKLGDPTGTKVTFPVRTEDGVIVLMAL